jgi:uncharacterized protein YebE (UPF0316 family)
MKVIFFSRILDQSIGTMRLIFVSKGFRHIGPILGFFEVIIWLLAITQVLKHLYNPMCYIAYGAGFAMGNYVGIRLEEKLSIGNVLIRIVPKLDTSELIAHLRDEGFGVTSVDAEGAKGPVKIVFTIIKRKSAAKVIDVINRTTPTPFIQLKKLRPSRTGILGCTRNRHSPGIHCCAVALNRGHYHQRAVKKNKGMFCIPLLQQQYEKIIYRLPVTSPRVVE